MRWGPRKHRKKNKWMPKILCPWKKNSPFHRDHYTIWHQPKQCTIKLNGKFMEIPPKLSYICWHSLIIPTITWWHLMMPASVKWALEGGTNALSSADGDKAHPNTEFSFNGEFVGSDRLENQKMPRKHRNFKSWKTKSSCSFCFDMLVNLWMYPKKTHWIHHHNADVYGYGCHISYEHCIQESKKDCYSTVLHSNEVLHEKAFRLRSHDIFLLVSPNLQNTVSIVPAGECSDGTIWPSCGQFCWQVQWDDCYLS